MSNADTEINSDYHFWLIHKAIFQRACLPGSGSAHFGPQLFSVMRCFDLRCKCYFAEVSEIQPGRFMCFCLPPSSQATVTGHLCPPRSCVLPPVGAVVFDQEWLAWLFLPAKTDSPLLNIKEALSSINYTKHPFWWCSLQQPVYPSHHLKPCRY